MHSIQVLLSPVILLICLYVRVYVFVFLLDLFYIWNQIKSNYNEWFVLQYKHRKFLNYHTVDQSVKAVGKNWFYDSGLSVLASSYQILCTEFVGWWNFLFLGFRTNQILVLWMWQPLCIRFASMLLLLLLIFLSLL